MAERPVECGHCKKSVKVIFKEIVGNTITITEMCSDCPILQQKLHGRMLAKTEEGKPEGESVLYCGHCKTSLESIITGNPLGCSECYSVFGDVLVAELIEANKIPPSLQKALTSKKSQLIHIGKSPKAVPAAAPSKLTALNEALNDALKKENYEQAAWLRDQIKALMEKKNDTKE